MTRLELLSSQLDMEALTPEIQAPQKMFAANLSFWKLCIECRKILVVDKTAKRESTK